MIEVRGLTVRYGARAALRDLSLSVRPGEFLLVSGPTGCGKSTLGLALTGLIPQAAGAAMEGRVTVDGLDTREHSIAALASRVGLLFQNPSTQLFHATPGQEAAFGPRNLGLPEAEVERRAAEALAAVGIAHLADRALPRLSTGERQRAALAAILAMQPRVLVLDEPTASLDWKGIGLLMTTLTRLNRERGMTILVIEHRLNAIYPHCSRLLLLRKGRICADGPPAEVAADRRRLVELGLRFPWGAITRGVERFTPDGIQPPPAARAGHPAAGPAGREPLVEMLGIRARYGRRVVLHDVSLALYAGELTALVGDNGAGKSTLARVLAGLLPPARGRVRWQRACRGLPLGRRTGFLFQEAIDQLLCESVREEVALAPECFRLPAGLAVQALLDTLDLAGLAARAPVSLSIGEQQRTALAACLAADPRLIILDEPTLGQDWGHLSRLMEYLQILARQGRAVLLITHDDKLVCRFARRVILLREGRIAADGPRRRMAPPGPRVGSPAGGPGRDAPGRDGPGRDTPLRDGPNREEPS